MIVGVLGEAYKDKYTPTLISIRKCNMAVPSPSNAVVFGDSPIPSQRRRGPAGGALEWVPHTLVALATQAQVFH